MVPVRSEPTQPELPSVLPIRLLPWEATVSEGIGPAGGGRVPRHDRVAERRPVPPRRWCTGRRRCRWAELPLTVQLVSVVVPYDVAAQAAAVVPRRSCR